MTNTNRHHGSSSMACPILEVPSGPLMIQPVAQNSSEYISLSVVVPTYQESEVIPELLRKLTAVLDAAFKNAYEVILVDDDSPDKTWELAHSMTAEYKRLLVMRRTGERCLSTAVIRGWQVSRGDVLAVLDADLQHPPETLLDLWKEIERGADLAVASRHVKGGGVGDWSVIRRLMSGGARLLGIVLLRDVAGRVADPMSTYFMFRRSKLQGRVLNPLGYKILLEVLGRGAFRCLSEVPYVLHERFGGKSKLTPRIYLDYVRHLWRLRRLK